LLLLWLVPLLMLILWMVLLLGLLLVELWKGGVAILVLLLV